MLQGNAIGGPLDGVKISAEQHWDGRIRLPKKEPVPRLKPNRARTPKIYQNTPSSYHKGYYIWSFHRHTWIWMRD